MYVLKICLKKFLKKALVAQRLVFYRLTVFCGTEQVLGHQAGKSNSKNTIVRMYTVVTLKSLFNLETYKNEHLKSYLHKQVYTNLLTMIRKIQIQLFIKDMSMFKCY